MIAKRNIQHPTSNAEHRSFLHRSLGRSKFNVQRSTFCLRIPLAPRGTSGERAGERGFKNVFRNNAPPLPAPLLRSAEEREFMAEFLFPSGSIRFYPRSK